MEPDSMEIDGNPSKDEDKTWTRAKRQERRERRVVEHYVGNTQKRQEWQYRKINLKRLVPD